MLSRTVTVNGTQWRVAPSGFITINNADEFALIFTRGEGDAAETRVTRYSPMGVRSREQSFRDLSDADLQRLLVQSQPGVLSPEAGYAR